MPHIGHAYTEVAADVLARWHRQAGDDTWLLTGTDEHGQKILRTAVANDVDARRSGPTGSSTSAWKPLLETIDIANDDFIRTTDARHETARRGLPAAALRRRPHLRGRVRGLLLRRLRGVQAARRPRWRPPDGDYAGQKVCKIHSRPVEILQGEELLLPHERRSSEQLLDLYETQPDFVQPESVRNEIVQFVKQGLDDLSISRSTFDWGIKVPWDDSHVIYVWFDALLNYVTAVGYGARRPRSSRAAGRPSTSSARTSPASTR